MKESKLINPFKPTAGMTPPVLIGRESVIDDFIDGLDEGAGAPGRLMRITGPRGSGKTVLLTELSDIALERGWSVVNASGKESLCPSIQSQLISNQKLQSLNIAFTLPFVSAEAVLDRVQRETTFRDAFAQAVRALTKSGQGLLITIDEVQDASLDDMAIIATNVQYMIRESQNIALLFAGLTTGVLSLLNGEGITFLRRAKAEELAPIPIDEVSSALRETITASGLQVEKSALDHAAKATRGYAYLVQLIGYYVWREGRRHASTSKAITLEDAKRGIAIARREFEASVLETALTGLTKPSIDYLLAMATSEKASATAGIAHTIGKSAAVANTYRRMLIERQIIESTAPGYVAFSIPFMREYLLDNKDEILSRFGI